MLGIRAVGRQGVTSPGRAGGGRCRVNEGEAQQVTPGFQEVGTEKGQRQDVDWKQVFHSVSLFSNGFNVQPIGRTRCDQKIW